VIESRLLGPEAVSILAVTSDGDEKSALKTREPPELTGGFVSVQAGHPDVEEDYLRPEGLRAGQRGRSIVGDLGPVGAEVPDGFAATWGFFCTIAILSPPTP
jgi:hypothetical protein